MAKSVEDFVIDFSKEEQGAGGGIRVRPGTYKVKIASAKPITSEEKGTPGLELNLVFTEGKYRKKKMRERLWATPKAYGRFRTLLEACGKKVPAKVNIVKIAKAVIGEELYVELDDETREGYPTRSRVTFEGFISTDDYDDEEEPDEDEAEESDDEDLDDEDEDDEPAPKKRRAKSKSKADDEDEDEDDLDLDDY